MYIQVQNIFIVHDKGLIGSIHYAEHIPFPSCKAKKSSSLTLIIGSPRKIGEIQNHYILRPALNILASHPVVETILQPFYSCFTFLLIEVMTLL